MMECEKEPFIPDRQFKVPIKFVIKDATVRTRSVVPTVALLAGFLGCLLVIFRLTQHEHWTPPQLNVFISDKKVNRLFPSASPTVAGSALQECSADPNHRFDCYPDKGGTLVSCVDRGCCWQAQDDALIDFRNRSARQMNVPFCFYPVNYPSYVGTNVKQTDFGVSLDLHKSSKSHWPNDILSLKMDVYFETKSRLRFKIYDPAKQRYEVPLKTPKVTKRETNPDYTFIPRQNSTFSFTITRKDSITVLFDTNIKGAPLIFTDQFLQISTLVPSGMLYGLGEHRTPLYHNFTQWQQYSFWARDQYPHEGANLYGSHPFFMSFDKNNQAYGVFFLNSNAMDVDLQPTPALTYRTIGGILDFYIFTGPTPDLVIQQYTEVIGKPFMPPYWALGFHLCRYGYHSAENLKATIRRMRDAEFPYDTQWTDIDYMDGFKDWTYNSTSFRGLPDIVSDLHAKGQHYVIIVDPGISSSQPKDAYPPYDEGIKKDIFIKDATGAVANGWVWPGKTAFPDFTHPATADYWRSSISDFHKVLDFDGLWIDMNEPSNFVFGSMKGCANTSLDKPPYTPGITSGLLAAKTLCPSDKQYLSSHYNLHSMYGHFEAVATHDALKTVLKKRSIVISRSSFPGTGFYSGHWSGDNRATWHDLQQSIPEMLSFQMFGIPLVGADICGFGTETTEELCVRWMQLGSFYPFMRNHNALGLKDQDPAVWSLEAQQVMKSAMRLRYTLLPFMYTAFYRSHLYGTAVVKPLSFKYNRDRVYPIDAQFLWGDDLLVSPVLEQGATSVRAFFPVDTWYNYLNGSVVPYQGSWVTLPAPIDTINVHQRAGTIIPTQRDAVTTTAARQLPFSLQIALDKYGEAKGTLFWDDGETSDTIENGHYNLLHFVATMGQVTTEVLKLGYQPPNRMILEAFRIMGVAVRPATVTINNTPVEFQYDTEAKALFVRDLAVDLLGNFSLKWAH